VIRVWSAYACNNSAAYRLVARFADAAAAREVSAELGEFFEAQAALEGQRGARGALWTMARNYGFDWTDGGAGDVSEGPHVVAEDRTVIVHHAYCLGLGPGVPAYIEDRAGKVELVTARDLHVSVLFRAAPGVDPRLDAELAAVFEQLGADSVAWKPPWARIRTSGRAAGFRDGGTVGLLFPCDPADLAGFKQWLAGHELASAVIGIEEAGDRVLFATVAAARCTACEGPLDYLDPRLHDIESPQLVCTPCGGLYDLATFAVRDREPG